ncbi:MAG TPA: glycosyltransferase [Burkholderiales bacterium]|nr:glycosyltransferase [Burkholderiales bacterium]
MRILFVHKSFPAQFTRLAPYLAAQPGVAVVALGDRAFLRGREAWLQAKSIHALGYRFDEDDRLADFEVFERRAKAVESAARELRDKGLQPDLIIAHASWGEAVHLRAVFERAKLIVYCEWFYNAPAIDDEAIELAVLHDAQTRSEHNARIIAALEAADAGWAPTQWQRAQFPANCQPKIAVIHDGVDTDLITPGEPARAEPLITFATRSLEPARGFHVFMRALPEIQRRRPEARIVVAGSDTVAYASRRADGASYRSALLHELGGRLDLSRITFAGMLPYAQYIELLRRSSVHVYGTFPFVLSWSFIDALAAGCLIVGSRTPPVEEVLREEDNGLLYEYGSPADLAARVDEALARPDADRIRAGARRTAVEHFDWRRVCLPAQLALIQNVLAATIQA